MPESYVATNVDKTHHKWLLLSMKPIAKIVSGRSASTATANEALADG